MGERENGRSVTRPSGRARLRAFDGVRRELGVVLILGVVAVLLVVGLDLRRWLELMLLAVVGFTAGGWIAVRTRVAERSARTGGEAGNDPE